MEKIDEVNAVNYENTWLVLLHLGLSVCVQIGPDSSLQPHVVLRLHCIYRLKPNKQPHTLKMDILFENGDPIPNLLRWVFHSQVKIKCLMKM